MALRIPRRLRELLDVDTSGAVAGDALVLDVDGETWVPGAGGGGADDQTAAEVPFTPTGSVSASDVQSAIAEVATDYAAAIAALSTTYQPLDSDLTAIADLTTTAFGRGLLEIANQAGLLTAAGAAAASHVHAGEDITSGTVADARIASTIARDSEVTAAISAHAAASDPHPTYTTAAELAAYAQPVDSDLTSIAALSTTTFGRGLLTLADAAALLAAAGAAAASHVHAGEDITSGTVADARIASTIARDSEVTSAIAALSSVYQPLDSDLTAVAGLSPSNDDVIQRKAGAWTNRTLAQLSTDLAVAVKVAARVRNSAVQSIPDNAWTTILYDTEVRDDGGLHSTSSNPGRMTAPQDGWYDCKAGVGFAPNVTGARGGRLIVNGTTVIAQAFFGSPPATSNSFDFPVDGSVYLAAGDYVEVQAYQNSGGSLNNEFGAQCAFSMESTSGPAADRTSFPGYELAYAEKTSDTSITATTEAGANTIVTAGAVTGDGVKKMLVEFAAATVQTPTAASVAVYVVLFDALNGGAAGIIGYLARVRSTPVASDNISAPVRGAVRLTPAAGSHVYSARALVDSGTATVEAGSGGSDYFPAFVRVSLV